MAIDLTLVPWDRLAKLAPPGTEESDLQAAATRHSTRTDVYAAAADLWEEAALAIDLKPDTEAHGPIRTNKISQDGITVEYASDPLNGDSQSTRHAQFAQYMSNARRLRKRSKPSSPLVHSTDYNPWINTAMPQDTEERIIWVDEV
jgi:hypothetical protein